MNGSITSAHPKGSRGVAVTCHALPHVVPPCLGASSEGNQSALEPTLRPSARPGLHTSSESLNLLEPETLPRGLSLEVPIAWPCQQSLPQHLLRPPAICYLLKPSTLVVGAAMLKKHFFRYLFEVGSE